jgi:hypothetical protein
MRNIEAASHPRTKRTNIFVRILEALHASRGREAQRVLHRYSHLIERHSRAAAPGIVPDHQQTEENHRNAHGNKSSIRANDGARWNAAGHSAQDQFV